MRYVATAAALFAASTCVGVDQPLKATRVIEGTKTTFPAKSLPGGVKALAATLASCTNMSDGTVRYTADDLKQAQNRDHVRFVFPRPLGVEVLGKKLGVSEAVFAEGVFWLACGQDVVRCTKYTIDTMERFREWYRQTLPAD
jgi:hypothetical protein